MSTTSANEHGVPEAKDAETRSESGPELDRAGSSLTAIDTLLNLPPTDDAGAQTADRYEWQAAMGAADGLAVHLQHCNGEWSQLNSSEIQIICEYHEDWVIRLGTEAELVSAKHREPASGPWKDIASLVIDGGIGHLFARWLMAGCKAAARLVTNAATAAGEATDLANCRDFLRALASGGTLSSEQEEKLAKCVDAVCRALMMYRKNLPSEWQAASGARSKDLTISDSHRAKAREFLLVFRIDQGRPGRTMTSHAAPSLYAQPLVAKLGQPATVSVAVWQAVLQVFRIRMQAGGTTERGGLPMVGAAAPSSSPSSTTVEERTVTLADIEIAITAAVTHPLAYQPISTHPRRTKLSAKMAHGGCAETSIERAERLRLAYSGYRRERRNSAPGGLAEVNRLERTLHRIADEETHRNRSVTGQWGADLWAALSTRLQESETELSSFQLDGDLGLGGICELSSRCHVWFSDKFDVESEIAKAVVPGGGSDGS